MRGKLFEVRRVVEVVWGCGEGGREEEGVAERGQTNLFLQENGHTDPRPGIGYGVVACQN